MSNEHYKYNCGLLLTGPIVYSSTWQYGIAQGPIWLYSVRCTGDEEQLFDCPLSSNYNPYSPYCDHYNDAGVMCQGGRTDFINALI